MDLDMNATASEPSQSEIRAAPPDHAQQSPGMQLFLVLAGKWLVQCVHVLAKLGVADLLADGPLEVSELAARTSTLAPTLRRVLRATAVVNIFTELADGRYALTPQAECLRTGVPGSLRSFAIFIGDDAFWRPYGDILQTLRTGDPAFDRVHGKSVYQYLAEHEDLAAVFDEAMTGLSEESAHFYLEAHDFGRYGTIADIGGGRGVMLAAILTQQASARGILFDLPDVVVGSKSLLNRAGVGDRVTVVGGDFFDGVPAGADAYVLKSVDSTRGSARMSTGPTMSSMPWS